MAKPWTVRVRRALEGVFVTVCALLGVRVAAFERRRLMFAPWDGGDGDGDDCDERELFVDGAVLATTRSPSADTLLVSFAGSTTVVGGFPRGEFRRTLRSACMASGTCADMLFLTDPAITFYMQDARDSDARGRRPWGLCRGRPWDAGAFYGEAVAKVARDYAKVMVVGSSMGGTGILATLGRFPCDLAVVFNPLVDLRVESRRMFWLGGLRVPARLRDALPAQIAAALDAGSAGSEPGAPLRRPCRLDLHTSLGSRGDVEQREVLCRLAALGSGQSRLTVVEYDSANHVLPRELAAQHRLVPLLADAIGSLSRSRSSASASTQNDSTALDK